MRNGFVVGVTGLPCSGKSLAAGILASGEIFGKPGELIKADDLGHRVLEFPEVRDALRRRFGEAPFRDPAPAAVRREIARRVFANAEDLAWLEGLLHPLIAREAEAALERTDKAGPAVVEAALLFGGRLERLCDRIAVVEARFETRLERAAERGWPRAELERRERRQLPLFDAESLASRKEKIVLVPNDGDEAALRKTLLESFKAF